ncbi:MAG: inner nuclear membrane protein enriched at telomere/subtelomere region [Peltula sp. TS41687]|nr:MAG: inner nuclear membrane protein enriched at telomere/subtelomere region [Peltula sp. TS41687]
MAFNADSEMEYLAPDFDPSSLKVPRLRSILVSHNIHYPPSAKKPQLIEIFNRDIVPKSRKILQAHSRTKPSSQGITDAESSQESTSTGDDDDDDATLMPPPSAVPDGSRRVGVRRSTRKVEEILADSIHQSPEKPSSSRGLSTKHPREPDTETGPDLESKRPMVRKTRYSDAGPAPQAEPLEPTLPRVSHEDSVFTDDNPFQSGSSPLSGGDRRASSGKRKKSLGPSVVKDAARRTSSNRLTKANDGIVVPTSKKFEAPVVKAKRELLPQDDIVEAGEEFTPEEQMELTREQLKEGVKDLLPPRPTRHPSGGGRVSRSAPWVIVLALLGGYATWWRREKLEVGYCGIGEPSTSLADVQIPDWAGFLQPKCEPCPPHAYCYAYMETRCEPDFVLNPHPLSLGGVIPLAPSCEPDGEKARKVKTVADRAVGELRERRAQYECGELVDDAGKSAPVEIDEERLKEKVGEKRRKGMTQAEFEDLWRGAIGEMVNKEEVVVKVDEHTGHRTLTSTSLARVSLGCAIRRSARLALARYRVELGGLITLMIGLMTIRRYMATLREARARVPELVKLTLDILATQAGLHAQDPRSAPEPWISVSQLRDDVLRDEFSPRRREDLWKRVRAIVEMNANVRASVREARTGEVSRVWEWIGHVGLLDEGVSGGGGGGGARRRQSGRFSLGSALGSSPTPMPESNRRETLQRWDEGRPIY